MEADPDDFTHLDYQRAEATRLWQQRRTLAIAMGEMYLSLARAHVDLRRDHRQACGLLVKASERFQAAGLTRRAKVVWRYSRMLHAMRWRAASGGR
jgi:hypothetical protein